MTTTIKVDNGLRDRLKAQAEADGLTLGGHLAKLADTDDRRRRFDALRDAIAATSPESMADYAVETAAWERIQVADESE